MEEGIIRASDSGSLGGDEFEFHDRPIDERFVLGHRELALDRSCVGRNGGSLRLTFDSGTLEEPAVHFHSQVSVEGEAGEGVDLAVIDFDLRICEDEGIGICWIRG